MAKIDWYFRLERSACWRISARRPRMRAANGELTTSGRVTCGKDIVSATFARDGWIMSKLIISMKRECLRSLGQEHRRKKHQKK